ncbi:MAG: HAD family phosphatase [Muribaculaceae bacterium]|nr:HAD family phosphatase [Muribaculaceae bacterium]
MNNNQKGALFDLDGVLIDSETVYTSFWQEVAPRYGQTAPTFALDIKGTTLTDILNTYFPDPQQQKEITELVHRLEDEIVYPVFEGVREFLDSLTSAGFRIAVVTSSDNTKMEYLFRQQPWMRSRFDAIITGSMVKNSKPDPEGYLLAAKNIGCNPQNCYVFEDSFQGLEAGRRAGATVIALATTNPREKLEGKAAVVIDGFAGLDLKQLPKI